MPAQARPLSGPSSVFAREKVRATASVKDMSAAIAQAAANRDDRGSRRVGRDTVDFNQRNRVAPVRCRLGNRKADLCPPR
jgi:hypothetical protein